MEECRLNSKHKTDQNFNLTNKKATEHCIVDDVDLSAAEDGMTDNPEAVAPAFIPSRRCFPLHGYVNPLH